MRSPGDPRRTRTRRFLEGVAHALALGMVAWLLARSLREPDAAPSETVSTARLAEALPRWSGLERPGRLHVTIDADLPPAAADWLAALGRTGATITWSGSRLTAAAAVADPVADPEGGTRVRAAAPGKTLVTLSDALGALDSVPAGGTGATFLVRSGPEWIRARAGVLSARAAVGDSLLLGRVLVLGRVSWESKFVTAALEERGWKVDARLALSPKGDVVQGPAFALDTARYAAVIVLDSTAPAPLAALGSYVREGGGAILSAAALRAPALRGLGAVGPDAPARANQPFDTASSEPRRSLALTPLLSRPGQVELERRGGVVAIAARRVDRGRVLLVGYQDTWRWRMAGGSDPVEAHRTWWAGLVAGVAHVGRVPRAAPAAEVDEAPFARLVERLGAPVQTAAAAPSAARISPTLLFAFLAALLLLGWGSRRLRGAP